MKIQLPIWIIEDAIALIRELQPKFHKVNCHLALAGSVLNRGMSQNDLDIIVMGMHNDKELNKEKVIELLYKLEASQLQDDVEYDLKGRMLFRSKHESKTIDWFVYDLIP